MFSEIEYNSWFRKKIVLLFVLIIVLVTVLEIWAVNRLATYGLEISKLENTRISLKRENNLLENEIAKISSLQSVQDKAKELGFVHISKIEYLKTLDLAWKSR